MDSYIDIELLKDPVFVPSILMNALFSKLHRSLVEQKSNAIGISFPNYRDDSYPLGLVLRLHSQAAVLKGFLSTNWLLGIRDHCLVGEIKPVPDQYDLVQVRRVHSGKNNVERVRRRQMKRHNLSYESVVKRVPESKMKTLKLPFLMMKSSSTQQQFRFFVNQTETDCKEISSHFNAYGFSQEGGLPLF